MRTPIRLLVNGDSLLQPMTWAANDTHRIRLINLGPATLVRVTLRKDSTLMTWQPVAKDGADLPVGQAVSRPATLDIYVGETADFLFTPSERGEYALTFTSNDIRSSPRTQRIIVH